MVLLMGERVDEQPFLLADLPPSQGQTRLAIAIAVVLLVAFGATAPFVNTSLQRMDAFIPTLEGIFVVNDLITSALLFSQFSITRRPLLVLSIGFLFTALIIIPHALSLPGAFAPAGLLGAGLQSTSWLYNFWKAGLPLAVILYVLLKDADAARHLPERSPSDVILGSVAIVVALVCGLTWIAITGGGVSPASHA
jgi:Membrane-associated sensor, integral membrane domain